MNTSVSERRSRSRNGSSAASTKNRKTSARAIVGQLIEEASRITGPIPGTDSPRHQVEASDTPSCKLYLGTPAPDRRDSVFVVVRINEQGHVTLAMSAAGEAGEHRDEFDLGWDWRVAGWQSTEADTEAIVPAGTPLPMLSAHAIIWKHLAAMTEAAFTKQP